MLSLGEELLQYTPLFEENGIENLIDLELITKADIKLFGISNIFHRKIMWDAITAVTRPPTTKSPTTKRPTT